MTVRIDIKYHDKIFINENGETIDPVTKEVINRKYVQEPEIKRDNNEGVAGRTGNQENESGETENKETTKTE